jgi:hypothetical protein
MAKSMYYPSSSQTGLQKITNPHQDRCSAQDSNEVPLEYKFIVLQLDQSIGRFSD